MDISPRHTLGCSNNCRVLQSADRFVAHPDVSLHRQKRKRYFPRRRRISRRPRQVRLGSLFHQSFQSVTPRSCAMDICSMHTRCATNISSRHTSTGALELHNGLQGLQSADRFVAHPDFSLRYLLSISYTNSAESESPSLFGKIVQSGHARELRLRQDEIFLIEGQHFARAQSL